MATRKNLLILFLILLFVGLVVFVSMTAFLLGRQAGTGVANTAAETPTPPAVTPSATSLPAVAPPEFVTNTPTSTPSPTPTVGPTDTPTPTPTNTPTPTPTPIVVITHVNALGRLETAEFAMQTVVDLENAPTNIWEQFVGSDKVMLVAEGEVVAGFDLNKVSEDDIVVRGTVVKMTLPAPEILYSRIDNEKTYVYERRTGLLVPPDVSLEGRARTIAEQALVDWAIERGIHDKAEEYGRIQLENFLRGLGFTHIIIEFKDSEL